MMSGITGAFSRSKEKGEAGSKDCIRKSRATYTASASGEAPVALSGWNRACKEVSPQRRHEESEGRIGKGGVYRARL